MAKCFRTNPDGAGFAWVATDGVHWQKGYKTFRKFLAAYTAAAIGQEHAHLIHFRLASAGGSGMEFSHPFPVSSDMEELYALRGVSESGVIVHNGTVPGLGITGGLSDSQVLAKRLARGVDLNPDDIGPSRVAMLTASGGVFSIGAWVTHNFGPTDSPPCQLSNYGFTNPELTLRYRIARWYRGLTADAKAGNHGANTEDRGLMVVDLKGVHQKMSTLMSAVGKTGGFYVDGDRRVYMMSVHMNGADRVCGNPYRIGTLALYRAVPPVPKAPVGVHRK